MDTNLKRAHAAAWTPEARAKRLATWKAKAKLRKRKPNGGEIPLAMIPDKTPQAKRSYKRRGDLLANFLAIVRAILER